MENNKRKTLDFYFCSPTQKKAKSICVGLQSEDGIDQNCTLQILDSNTCISRDTNDEPVETFQMKSAQNVSTEEEQKMHREESTTSEVSLDVVDISLSCQDPPAQSKLASYPKNHDNRSCMLKWYDGRSWLKYIYPRKKIVRLCILNIFLL